MGLTASEKGGGGDFETTPEGQYVGRCYKLIDMGTQTSTGQYGTKEQHKVMVSWELLDGPKMDDGRPFTVTQFYTVSLHEKAKLRADLEAWRGKKFTPEELEGFDLGTVLGAYCIIQVVHNKVGDKTYANVQTIMSYRGDKPEAVNENVVFDIDEPDMAVLDAMSDNMRIKITSAPEWKASDTIKNAAPTSMSTAVAATTNSQQEITKSNVDEIFNVGDEPVNLDDIPF